MSDDVLVVRGGSPLHGQITVRGAKNLVSKAMVAALLGDAPSHLYDVPAIRDVEVVTGKKSILSYLFKPFLRARSEAFTER